MSNLVQTRVRRFQALHALLTGGTTVTCQQVASVLGGQSKQHAIGAGLLQISTRRLRIFEGDKQVEPN